MKDLGYYNGRFGPLCDMTVPMNDRACWFGDGVYDATCCRNHKIYMLDAHIDRFFNSAAMLDIVIPHTKDQLKQLLCDMVCRVDDPDQFVYWQVTRAGQGYRAHDYAEPLEPGNMWITLRPMKIHDVHDPIRLITQPDTRFFHCNIKTINLIPTVMANHRAARAGCYEAVFHRDGRVTECSHSNISILENGTFRTAPTDNLILPGIARANLIRFCGQLGIPVSETAFDLDTLRAADEIIVSSSSSFCLGAVELDGKPVGGRAQELLHALQDAAMRDFITATN
ncbi:MAG: aminotransferase class IV [Eubacteriales bacterium]|nr:aminotransferase class IV [Eubacteriales bacterium]